MLTWMHQDEEIKLANTALVSTPPKGPKTLYLSIRDSLALVDRSANVEPRFAGHSKVIVLPQWIFCGRCASLFYAITFLRH